MGKAPKGTASLTVDGIVASLLGDAQDAAAAKAPARAERAPSRRVPKATKTQAHVWEDCPSLDKFDAMLRSMLHPSNLPRNVAPPPIQSRRVKNTELELRHITSVQLLQLPASMQKLVEPSESSQSKYRYVMHRTRSNQVTGDTTAFYPQLRIYVRDGTGKPATFTLGVMTDARRELVRKMLAQGGHTISQLRIAVGKIKPAGPQSSKMQVEAIDGTGRAVVKNFKTMGSYWDPRVASVAASLAKMEAIEAGAQLAGACTVVDAPSLPTEDELKQRMLTIEKRIQDAAVIL